jgi:hypothetical protein
MTKEALLKLEFYLIGYGLSLKKVEKILNLLEKE